MSSAAECVRPGEAFLVDWYAALDAGDWDRVLSGLADSVSWRIRPNTVVRQVDLHGRAGVAAWFRGGPHRHRTRHEIRDIVDAGSAMVVTLEVWLGYEAFETEAQAVDVFGFRDGLVTVWSRVIAE